MAVNPIPTGYSNVTPYLVVNGVARLIEFLKQAFGAEERERFSRADGTVMHAQVKVGNSIVMMGEPMGGQMPPMPSNLYLYVEYVDDTYRRAVQAGAVSLKEPADQFYGDRTASVRDPSGNLWWIATHKEDVAPEEMKRRVESVLQQRAGGGGA